MIVVIGISLIEAACAAFKGPDAVVRSPDNRLVVRKEAAPTWLQQSENEILEGRHEVKILSVQKADGQIVVSPNLFDKMPGIATSAGSGRIAPILYYLVSVHKVGYFMDGPCIFSPKGCENANFKVVCL
jgi:hypothetical protein